MLKLFIYFLFIFTLGIFGTGYTSFATIKGELSEDSSCSMTVTVTEMTNQSPTANDALFVSQFDQIYESFYYVDIGTPESISVNCCRPVIFQLNSNSSHHLLKVQGTYIVNTDTVDFCIGLSCPTSNIGGVVTFDEPLLMKYIEK
jgi:hypothetical protein